MLLWQLLIFLLLFSVSNEYDHALWLFGVCVIVNLWIEFQFGGDSISMPSARNSVPFCACIESLLMYLLCDSSCLWWVTVLV